MTRLCVSGCLFIFLVSSPSAMAQMPSSEASPPSSGAVLKDESSTAVKPTDTVNPLLKDAADPLLQIAPENREAVGPRN